MSVTSFKTTSNNGEEERERERTGTTMDGEGLSFKQRFLRVWANFDLVPLDEMPRSREELDPESRIGFVWRIENNATPVYEYRTFGLDVPVLRWRTVIDAVDFIPVSSKAGKKKFTKQLTRAFEAVDATIDDQKRIIVGCKRC